MCSMNQWACVFSREIWFLVLRVAGLAQLSPPPDATLVDWWLRASYAGSTPLPPRIRLLHSLGHLGAVEGAQPQDLSSRVNVTACALPGSSTRQMLGWVRASELCRSSWRGAVR